MLIFCSSNELQLLALYYTHHAIKMMQSPLHKFFAEFQSLHGCFAEGKQVIDMVQIYMFFSNTNYAVAIFPCINSEERMDHLIVTGSAVLRLRQFRYVNSNRIFRYVIIEQFRHVNLLLRWPSGKRVRLLSCGLKFDSESGQTNDFKIGIHSFPARHSASKGQCEEQAGTFTCCAIGKGS